jgi:hypothetical protein
MTSRPGDRRAGTGAIPRLAVGSLFLVAASFLAAEPLSSERTKGQQPEPVPAGRDARVSTPAPQQGKSESLARPPGQTRPSPEQANPALVNPCRASPQPKWCGE